MALGARMQKKQWDIRPPHPQADQMAQKLKVSPLLAQVLLNRQITDHPEAMSFLSPKLMDLIEPAEMPGIGPAVKRIKEAIKQKQKIAIYGDYDVDGITAISILWQLFNLLGVSVEYYIPHRLEEGYGLNDDAITQLAEAGTELLITVDCGISANTQADHAKNLGMDLVITDHHQPPESPDQFPHAAAIVHPAIDGYPNPNSAGATVAFKLAWALANEFKTGAQTSPETIQFLLNASTLAAIGTVADVVDLRGENRILTSYGLKALPESKIRGITALIETADLTGQSIDSYHIAFRLAPMINAAGRMGHARLAVELLTSDSEHRCLQIAEYLKDQNRQRQQLERKMTTHTIEIIRTRRLDHPDRKTIVLADETWHKGIVGIVASRIIDTFYRPTILLNSSGPIASGSARSIEGFNILDAIAACSEHLVSFGGHAMAAGLALEIEKIPLFAEAFEDYAQQNLEHETLVSTLDIDGLQPVADFTEPLVKQLSMLEPFGKGNPKPLFATKGVKLISPPRKVGARNSHLQLAITDNTASVRCIGFGMGKLEKKLLETDYFNVAYHPQINSYNGYESVQFVINDIQFE